jgi:hypothetical protein
VYSIRKKAARFAPTLDIHGATPAAVIRGKQLQSPQSVEFVVGNGQASASAEVGACARILVGTRRAGTSHAPLAVAWPD